MPRAAPVWASEHVCLCRRVIQKLGAPPCEPKSPEGPDPLDILVVGLTLWQAWVTHWAQLCPLPFKTQAAMLAVYTLVWWLELLTRNGHQGCLPWSCWGVETQVSGENCNHWTIVWYRKGHFPPVLLNLCNREERMRQPDLTKVGALARKGVGWSSYSCSWDCLKQ